MRLGPRRRIKRALTRVIVDISYMAKGGKYAAGLAQEGYCGGYADALRDVQLVLDGIVPKRRDWWEEGK